MIFKALTGSIVTMFFEMAPYLLLGLTVAGVLHILFKKEFIIRHLGGSGVISSVKAALLGVPLPLCSCGVIPTALSLRRSRASEGATVSFLISTPQTGIDSIVATYGMLGPVFALFRPIAAFIMGIAGGIITGLIPGRKSGSGEETAEGFDCPMCVVSSPHSHSFMEKIAGMIRYAYMDFLDDISIQLIVGIVISGLISVFIPPEFFGRYIGNDLVEMLLMIAGGIPLYVCATASIPIAAALMMKGLSPGAAFVFLAVGPATNAAAIALIANAMGKRVVAIYLSVISVFSIAAGFVLNGVYRSYEMPAMTGHAHGAEGSAGALKTALSLFFLLLLVFSVIRKSFPGVWRGIFRKREKESLKEGISRKIVIQGMTCSHCARHVEEAILGIEGVKSATVDLNAKTAHVTGSFDIERVRDAIGSAGYKVTG